MISETYSAVSAPIQYAAMMAYSGHPEIVQYLDTCRKVHAAVGVYMAGRLRAMGATVSDPQGAFYLLAHCGRFAAPLKAQYGVRTSGEMAQLIYEKTRVATLPASDFYMPEEFLGMRLTSVDYDGQWVLGEAERAFWIDRDFVQEYCPRIVQGMDRLRDFFSRLGDC